MEWGFFSPLHITTIIFAAGLIIALYFLLKGKSDKIQVAILLLCSTICIWNVIRDFFSTNIWQAMPLHLCGLNAMLLPIAIVTRNKVLNNLLLLWSLGALAAIVVNTAQAHFIVPSDNFIFYYFSHVFEFGIPILMFGLGLVKKDQKCISSTMLITLGIYTLVHMYNCWVAAFTDTTTNFMYSMRPENPIFDLFYKIIPHQYWYLYLVMPIAFLYLIAVYYKQIFRTLKHKNHIKKNTT